jgi:hypothetical protein
MEEYKFSIATLRAISCRLQMQHGSARILPGPDSARRAQQQIRVAVKKLQQVLRAAA